METRDALVIAKLSLIATRNKLNDNALKDLSTQAINRIDQMLRQRGLAVHDQHTDNLTDFIDVVIDG